MPKEVAVESLPLDGLLLDFSFCVLTLLSTAGVRVCAL